MWFNEYDEISAKLDRLERRLNDAIAILNQLLNQEKTMAIDLTKITAEVANNTAVDASIEQLVQNLAAQIAAIPVSTDPVTQAALDQLTSTLTTNDAAIAAAVTANTPAAPASAAKAS